MFFSLLSLKLGRLNRSKFSAWRFSRESMLLGGVVFIGAALLLFLILDSILFYRVWFEKRVPPALTSKALMASPPLLDDFFKVLDERHKKFEELRSAP